MNKRKDEMVLAAAVLSERCIGKLGLSLDQIADGLGIPIKRAYYLAGKWKWYDWGVSLRHGWVADEVAARKYIDDKA